MRKKRLVRLIGMVAVGAVFFDLSGQWPDVMMMHRFDKKRLPCPL
jgi:hypothetical protein